MDGKIMKCWIRPAEKTGAVGRLPSGKTRPAGHLEHEKENPGWKKKNGHYHRSSKGGGEWSFSICRSSGRSTIKI